MQRIHFILLQGFIVFHQGITFTIGPNEPFGRSISLNSAPPRSQTEADTCAAQAILIEVAPPRPQTEADTCTAQAIMIEVAPPGPQTEAAARAQRRLLYK